MLSSPSGLWTKIKILRGISKLWSINKRIMIWILKISNIWILNLLRSWLSSRGQRHWDSKLVRLSLMRRKLAKKSRSSRFRRKMKRNNRAVRVYLEARAIFFNLLRAHSGSRTRSWGMIWNLLRMNLTKKFPFCLIKNLSIISLALISQNYKKKMNGYVWKWMVMFMGSKSRTFQIQNTNI